MVVVFPHFILKTCAFCCISSLRILLLTSFSHWTGIRCSMSTIMLEMDRILRPGGHVYIRDTVAIMDELQAIGKAMGWRITLRDTSEGPHASYRILIGEKRLLRAWKLLDVLKHSLFSTSWKWESGKHRVMSISRSQASDWCMLCHTIVFD